MLGGRQTAGHYYYGRETTWKACGGLTTVFEFDHWAGSQKVGGPTVVARLSSIEKGKQQMQRLLHIHALCTTHHVVHGTRCTEVSEGTQCAHRATFQWPTMDGDTVWGPLYPFPTTPPRQDSRHEKAVGKGYCNPDGGACLSTAPC